MKVVINACYGGFSLSPKAVKRLAELNGRECYFYRMGKKPDGNLSFDIFELITLEQAEEEFMWFVYDIPNVQELKGGMGDFYSKPLEERKSDNQFWEDHSLDHGRELVRHDPKLLQVIDELGAGHRTGASGKCAKLKIVEIPDGTDYVIEEYDGYEHIAEAHREWR